MAEALHRKRRGRRFDSGLSHHPACPCREVVFFLSSFPARRMPGMWGGSSEAEQRPAKPWPQVRILSIPPALCVGRRVSLLPAAGRNAAPGPTPPGLVIPGCPYTDPSGHGLPLVRAPSEFVAPRIHHGSVFPAEGPPNFIHLFSREAPRKDGAAAGGIPLPWQPCHKRRARGFGRSSNGSTPFEKWQAVQPGKAPSPAHSTQSEQRWGLLSSGQPGIYFRWKVRGCTVVEIKDGNLVISVEKLRHHSQQLIRWQVRFENPAGIRNLSVIKPPEERIQSLIVLIRTM